MSWLPGTVPIQRPRNCLIRLCTVFALAAACADWREKDTVITHVNVIDPDGGTIRSDQTVTIRGARILSVAPAGRAPASESQVAVDGTGKYLMPGLWDMHVHVSGNDAALNNLLDAGVTGARDMGGDFAKLADARRRITAGELEGPRLVIAGPILRGPDSPTDASDDESRVVRTPDEGRGAVDAVSALGVDFVKVHENLAHETFLAIANAARAKRLPLVGHVPAALTPAEASAAGEASIEHLEWVPDACLPLFNEKEAVVPPTCRPEALASLLLELSRNGTWLDPTIGSFRQWAPDQWELIFAGFRSVSGDIRRSGIRLLAGTDWSSSLESRGSRPGASLHDELALLVDAGFTPADALRSATSNPARFLGLWDSMGSIDEDKTADLVLLDADPLQDIRNTARVVAVVRDGHVVRSSKPGAR